MNPQTNPTATIVRGVESAHKRATSSHTNTTQMVTMMPVTLCFNPCDKLANLILCVGWVLSGKKGALSSQCTNFVLFCGTMGLGGGAFFLSVWGCVFQPHSSLQI